ncbi:MAG: hypothetical protein JXR76_02860 [Deltaproteobacteria bacterium]|nr:hypothetical protein [Deltaproteobacteria bacterium]
MREQCFNFVQALRCDRINDVSFSYALLLLILAMFGCGTRSGENAGEKQSDNASASRDAGLRGKDGANGKTISLDVRTSAPPAAPVPAPNYDGPSRIVSADGKHRFTVAVSFNPVQTQRHHMLELLVGPYHDELFACARVYGKESDSKTYMVQFRVTNGHQIIYEKLTFSIRAQPNQTFSIRDSDVATCLLGLYQNAVVELSGTIPFKGVTLAFDFEN